MGHEQKSITDCIECGGKEGIGKLSKLTNCPIPTGTACTQKPEGETLWSVRTLAKATGVGRDTVHQILRQANLKPYRTGTFSRSTDPDFAARVVDVVGLYMHPPENAVVVCVDEKTQVHALDRTQLLLPMRPGQIERRTETRDISF